MKVKIKKTGEIVDVTPVFDYDGWVRYYVSNNGTKFEIGEIAKLVDNTIPKDDVPSEECMRYELAKAAMQGILANPNYANISVSNLSSSAMQYAESVLIKLKRLEV